MEDDDEQEEETETQRRIEKTSMTDLFRPSEDSEDSLSFVVSSPIQFRAVVKATSNDLSFRQTVNMINDLNKETTLASLGTINLRKVISFLRVVSAVNFDSLSEVLNSTWAFSLALDIGNKHSNSYLDLRVELVFNGGVQNLHVCAFPLEDKHTGKNIAEAVKNVMTPICPTWKENCFRSHLMVLLLW